MTKERPIIFNAAMAQALLAGRKTQTRRPIKLQPVRINDDFDGTWEWKEEGHYYDNLTLADMLRGHCPFQAGMKLWVREIWHAARQYDELKPSLLPIGSTLWYAKDCCSHGWASRGEKRVSIYMPRWASRITLEVTRAWIEQIQDISHSDALAEGIDTDAPYNNYGTGSTYRDTFAELWDTINQARGFGWSINPWVWVVEFARLEV